jgi:hypothetical protein
MIILFFVIGWSKAMISPRSNFYTVLYCGVDLINFIAEVEESKDIGAYTLCRDPYAH